MEEKESSTTPNITEEIKEVLDPKSAEKALKKMKRNPWMFASMILSVLLIVSLITVFNGGKGISPASAGQIVVDFANGQTGGGVELVDINEISGLYEVNVLYQGQSIPLYITRDGKTLVQGIMPLEEVQAQQSAQTQSTTQEVVKTERPEVDLFVWGYCPYGVQAQGPFTEVAQLLGDSADFNIIYYYDGHGPYETQQNKIGACIQELEPEKFWDYSAKFVTDVYPTCSQSRDIECDKSLSVEVMDSVGIDSDAVFECVDNEGADLIAADSAYAQQNGVTGSPTLLVNGVKMSVARTAEAYKGAVCSGFLESPEACETTLDSEAAAAAGSC